MSMNIKFRARRVDNHPVYWAVGYLVKTPITTGFNADGSFLDLGIGRWCIVENGVAHEIDVNTIGQCTGIYDKNSKEVYEGDIIALYCGGADGATARHNILGEIKWNEDRWIVSIPDKIVTVRCGSMAGKKLSWREIHTWTGEHFCLREWDSSREVIGNVYENPEVLKQ